MPGPGDFFQGVADAKAKAQQEGRADQHYERIGSLGGFKDSLFGKPVESTSHKFAQDLWQRYHVNERYTKEEKRVIVQLENTVRKIFDALVTKCIAEKKTEEETHEELRKFDGYIRMYVVTGESLKTVHTPYERLDGEEGARSPKETFEVDELLLFERFTDKLNNLDIDDLLNMILEDQQYVTMLVEAQASNEKAVAEPSPRTVGRSDVPDGTQMLSVDTDMLDTGKKGPDGKPILEPVGKFDREHNPNYYRNLAALRDLIQGRPTQEGKERSADRRGAEAVLWLQIVRNLEFAKKVDLVREFLKLPDQKKAPEQTMNFIQACIMAGAMTRDEAREMYHLQPELAKRLDPHGDFDKKLQEAVTSREMAQTEMASQVQQILKPSAGNFLNENLTFTNFFVGRFIDFGLLTVAVNAIMIISSRFKKRKSNNESWYEAIAKGTGEAATDGYVWFGLGEIAFATYTLAPTWVKSKIYAPGKDEKAALDYSQEEEKIHNEIGGHPDMAPYFTEHYDEYRRTADRNKTLGRAWDLLPGDVVLSNEKAHELGYVDGYENGKFVSAVERATGAVHRIWGICTRVFKEDELNDSAAVARFFKKSMSDEVTSLKHQKLPNDATS